MSNALKSIYDWQALLAHRRHELSAIYDEAYKLDDLFFEDVTNLDQDIDILLRMMCNRTHQMTKRARRLIEQSNNQNNERTGNE